MLHLSNGYIYIKGQFTSRDPTKIGYLSDNELAFFFGEIQYDMVVKCLCYSSKPSESNVLLGVGWSLSK